MSRYVALHHGSGIFFKKIPELNVRRIQVSQTGLEEKRWPYVLAMPIFFLLTLWVILKKRICKNFGIVPKTNTFLFDGLGVFSRKVREGSKSWRALHIIYNPLPNRHGLGLLVDRFWWGIRNCQAIRNRLKITKSEIRKAIMGFGGEKEVRVISLACGSAQAMIEAIAELKDEGVTARVLLVDIDPSALAYASTLATQYGVLNQVTTIEASACKVAKIVRDLKFKPHVVEMVGLLDYLKKDKAIRLFTRIRSLLEKDGIFITCNIAPNSEMRFVHWVIDWEMTYRTSSDLAEIVSGAGFKKIRFVQEPLAIHNLAICQKDGA